MSMVRGPSLAMISVVLAAQAASGCGPDAAPPEAPRLEALPVLSPDLEGFPREFSVLVGAVLVDSTVVIADRAEALVAALDWDHKQIARIGREGSGGPGEYRTVEGLIRFPGDTLVVRADRAWHLFTRDGWTYIRTERPPWLGLASRVSAGVDGQAVFVSGNLGGNPLDELQEHPVVRLQGLERFDTITFVRVAETMDVPLDTEGGRAVFRRARPFSHRDLWAPGTGGELIVARTFDSSIEFLSPGSTTRQNVSVPKTPIWPEERQEPDPRFDWDWPKSKPGFGAGGVVVDNLSGQAWVPINENIRHATRDYVVVDRRQGARILVRFPIGFRLFGVGDEYGYGSMTDAETGLVKILRFSVRGLR